MQKLTGFKIVSIIYFVILYLLALVLFLYVDVPPVIKLEYSFILLLSFVLVLIAFIIILRKNKKGTLKKTTFIFPIVLGFAIWYTILGIPYGIVAIVSMKKIHEASTTNETTSNSINSEDTVVYDESNSIELDNQSNLNEAPIFNSKCTGEKNISTKKTNRVTFWIVTIIYAITLVLSIISLFDVKILWDNAEMNKVSAGWLIAFSASYGLYLFLLSPFDFKIRVKIIGSIASIVLMLVIDIFPIVLLIKYKDILSSINEGEMFGWFSSYVLLIITMIVSEIGIIALYLLSLARLNPEKIKNKKQVDTSYNEKARFWVFILKLLSTMIIAIFNSSLALMRLKEKHINIYSVFIVLLCSYLCVVLTEILLMLLVIFAIGLFIMIAASMYTPSTHYVYEVYDGGYTRTLTYDSYVYSESCDRYKDDLGNYWYTKDNGSTFFKEI